MIVQGVRNFFFSGGSNADRFVDSGGLEIFLMLIALPMVLPMFLILRCVAAREKTGSANVWKKHVSCADKVFFFAKFNVPYLNGALTFHRCS